MICPSCSEDITPQGVDIAPPLAICPACERSLVLTDGGARLATASDTENVTAAQTQKLKALRVETRKARLAYYAAHH